PDQAEVGQRITSSTDQEHAERRVEANDHQGIVRMPDVPCPSGWPEDHERIEGETGEARNDERDAKVAEAVGRNHSDLLRVSVTFRPAMRLQISPPPIVGRMWLRLQNRPLFVARPGKE